MDKIRKQRWQIGNLSSAQMILIGFLIVILLGTLLLMLPVSTAEKGGASFLEALFTATSATCVTGLVVQDTATYWSVFGKGVILLLIQIGGMGVVTVAVFFAMLSGRKIGLMQRSTMQESISAHHVGGIVRLTRFILKTAVLIEAAGAVLLFPVFCREFGWKKGLGYSVFHSISAFCNAGFDLMGCKEKFSSLTAYSGQWYLSLVISALIITGGIGFLTWEDIKTKRLRIHKYRMQTKVILSVSAGLILIPAVYFFFAEFRGNDWSGMTIMEKMWNAFFQSVTTRTAGFNTVDLTKMKESGKSVMILLMLIGGSPGSTAGGMKTTTVAVLAASAFSVFGRKEDVQMFRRRIPIEVVRTASALFQMYFLLSVSGAILVSLAEGLPVLTCMFETASAIGTVGLTLGVTPKLGLVSRIVLIVLMFLGRVGGMTVIFAAISGKNANLSKLPQEKITVG